MRWPFVTRSERLRREAADWVALLNGPHSAAEQAAFDRWYRASTDHASAFDRISGLFAVAGRARRPEQVAARLSTPPRKPRLGRLVAVGAAACAAMLALLILSARTALPPGKDAQLATFSTDPEERRHVRLSDGSELFLAAASSVEIAFGRNERRLRLAAGEARFSVAREPRPFIVAAHDAEVLARGTEFVVRLGEDRTTVALIEGRVEVSYLAMLDRRERRRVALRPGQHLTVPARADAAEASARAPEPSPAPTPPLPAASERMAVEAAQEGGGAMLQFDDVPLADAVRQVNGRSAGPQVRLADPALASLRITGAFRAGDARGFAEGIAAAFALDLEPLPGGSLLLRRRPNGG